MFILSINTGSLVYRTIISIYVNTKENVLSCRFMKKENWFSCLLTTILFIMPSFSLAQNGQLCFKVLIAEILVFSLTFGKNYRIIKMVMIRKFLKYFLFQLKVCSFSLHEFYYFFCFLYYSIFRIRLILFNIFFISLLS